MRIPGKIGAPPASLKLEWTSAVVAADCGTRRYSAESVVDVFAEKITQPPFGPGSTAVSAATASEIGCT